MKLLSALLLVVSTLVLRAAPSSLPPNLAEYFEAETAGIEHGWLQEVRNLKDWEQKRPESLKQYLEMLGLQPMPPRTDLNAVVTGKLEFEDFIVEKVHFQAMPKVYVTANLYLPRKIDKPLPAILYVCGHGRVFTNGVSCGNKTAYQHHGIWFARNGYAALLIDTLQLGEIEGVHHGTYRMNQWWWNSRGYTPAGIEAWFGVRALDYLCSRPEVDNTRIGMTGRSGGGAYTWTVAAIDDRVKVAAPVAGITDLRNHVIDGVVEGHCDCMFHLNTYRWDYPQAAALVAPRPLLIANTDKDTIFPLDGVVRTYNKVRQVYSLYGKTDQLGLLITDGPHADTQDLQVPVFRWMNRFLKGEQPLIEMAAQKLIAPEKLRVFDRLPADELNTKIQNTFGSAPVSRDKIASREALQHTLRDLVFRGWPSGDPQPQTHLQNEWKHHGQSVQRYSVQTQPSEDLQMIVVSKGNVKRIRTVTLHVIGTEDYTNHPAATLWLEPHVNSNTSTLDSSAAGQVHAFFFPRSVAAPWMADSKSAVHVRRRYMLLGQTLDGMRVWDIWAAVAGLRSIKEFKTAEITLSARGNMAVNAAYAALFAQVSTDLRDVPKSHSNGPDYLNVLRVCDVPNVLELVRP